MTELLEDVRRRVLGIRRADWIHEAAKGDEVSEGMPGKSLAGTIERFRSTVYSRMKKAEHYASKEDLDKAWKELDAAMISIQSLTKAINIARHEGVEFSEAKSVADVMGDMDYMDFEFTGRKTSKYKKGQRLNLVHGNHDANVTVHSTEIVKDDRNRKFLIVKTVGHDELDLEPLDRKGMMKGHRYE